ncbi:hypothetical protein A1Q2_07091 [Trichosporon asahii var. asahii CBS 8904]|uniref:Uncharacterized protein n=2 Tax=Trichosporon asahii var. asahii TaxID=189963 RepID=K1V3R7_TRIAC|nr:hypothetical protein A1Q1_07832 [Trichosporon asahii var. asahii CBS 2479]EJT50966.1 hypothetical protein A1Q1_07832 [Trichosporon asahii var. asahii CBS 2479]EKC98599.1 hypothetical protein A1Q2_07091 [Trichosporon asahii var. asahii CBS 8904]
MRPPVVPQYALNAARKRVRPSCAELRAERGAYTLTSPPHMSSQPMWFRDFTTTTAAQSDRHAAASKASIEVIEVGIATVLAAPSRPRTTRPSAHPVSPITQSFARRFSPPPVLPPRLAPRLCDWSGPTAAQQAPQRLSLDSLPLTARLSSTTTSSRPTAVPNGTDDHGPQDPQA